MSGFYEGTIIFLVGLGLKYEWFYSHKTNVMHTRELSDPAFPQVSAKWLLCSLKILAQRFGVHT